VFAFQDTYIVHGEFLISRIDRHGNILWQQDGADIFISQTGEESFKLTDTHIIARDWENKPYLFSYNGESID
jgi:hypothetical protein